MSHEFASDLNATVRRQSVLVVESNARDLVDTVNLLRSVGYQVAQASGFHQGKRLLESNPPDLLIAGVKLGAYNGLHLIVRAHAKHPEMASILTSDAVDPVLEAEAGKQHAIYLNRPWRRQDLFRAIMYSFETDATDAGHTRVARPDDSAFLFSGS